MLDVRDEGWKIGTVSLENTSSSYVILILLMFLEGQVTTQAEKRVREVAGNISYESPKYITVANSGTASESCQRAST